MAFYRTVYLIIISCLISACSSIPDYQPAPGSPQQLWLKHQQQLRDITAWRLQGQIAFITPQERNSATLNWQQLAQDFSINLTGPFGIHLMTIKRSAGIATLILDDNQQYQDSNAQRLINQLSPLPIPIDELRYWIMGEPLSDDLTLDRYGRVSQAAHPLGWQISYRNYQLINNIWLPKNISIKKDDIRIKIITRDWKIDAT
ncbi:MAG: outer membrane lipoprotein LolB [Moritella sp.]|jgi:outer membrane lipoprotein LolB